MSAKLWTEEQFNCPVCLDLPNDPVTIPCGHSYCMGCIKDYWSKDDPNGVFSCPQCRQTFCPKPSLSRNTMLAEAVEQLRRGARETDVRASMRSRGGSSSASATSTARLPSSAVPCDLCKGERRAAVRSCLACMSSYCEAHLKPHRTKKSLKQHELIPPTGDLAEKICTQHKYLQEFFCRQCRMFVCWLCTSNYHKEHECVSTKAERLERQKLLSDVQADNQQRLKDREQELKDVRKVMEGMKRSSHKVQQDVGQALTELQRSVERLQELLEETLDQASLEKTGQAQELAASLEAEVQERRRRDTEMRDLVSCEDHIHYLQTCDSMCSPLESGDLPAVHVNPDASLDPVGDVVLALRERVEDLCNQELGKITKQVNDTTLFTLGEGNRSRAQKGLLKREFPPDFYERVDDALTGPDSSDTQHLSWSPKRRQTRCRSSGRQEQRFTTRRREHELPQTGKQTAERGEGDGEGGEPQPQPCSQPQGVSVSLEQVQPGPGGPRCIPGPGPGPGPDPSPSEPRSRFCTHRRYTFSRMASISSLFRSNRRGASQAVPAAPSAAPAAAGNPWGVAALTEAPAEVNPGLFLDSPSPDAVGHPAFPALREINLDSLQAPEPRTRDEFLQYCVTLVLDPNTAHRRLALSEGDTKATLQGAAAPQPDAPQRFDGWTQVLSRSPLQAQRCYWEVEWRGRGSSMGVAYGSLSRKGSDARAGLGYNAQSWTLELSDTCCAAMHDNQKRDIPVGYSPRLGVYLDLAAGALHFYSVAGSMTHLHTFRANFTQPLYAAFGVGSGVGVGLDFALGQFTASSDSIKICPL
ncbi:E3 ubiquitin/ISG15 ligase TRIM25 [Cololabis saira]|uniref:E3 ubiquitin/ISG15 ligase TRIM25 n=1 Tax=Cololabis saira TaxID=129043 RepID=UPI002AD3C2BB|nr:E3 ubiquitin/ISG15 ligase TRIM25 [Cololabis saira]